MRNRDFPFKQSQIAECASQIPTEICTVSDSSAFVQHLLIAIYSFSVDI